MLPDTVLLSLTAPRWEKSTLVYEARVQLPQALIVAVELFPGTTGREPASFSAPFSLAIETTTKLKTAIGIIANFVIVFIFFSFSQFLFSGSHSGPPRFPDLDTLLRLESLKQIEPISTCKGTQPTRRDLLPRVLTAVESKLQFTSCIIRMFPRKAAHVPVRPERFSGYSFCSQPAFAEFHSGPTPRSFRRF